MKGKVISITCGKKSHVSYEDFVKKVKRYHPEFEIIGEYRGISSNVTFRCGKCGKTYTARGYRLYSGQGCPQCSRHWEITNHEEFLEALARMHPTYEVLSEYKGRNKKVRCRCQECNYEWEDRADGILSWRKNCPNCYKPKTRTTKEEFLARLAETNPDVELIGEFTNMHGTTTFRCKKCNHVWLTSPTHLVGDKTRTTCPRCIAKRNGLNLKKTHEEFVAQMKKINPSLEIVGTYHDAHTPIAVICPKCGKEHLVEASNLLKGWQSCRSCRMKELNDSKRWTDEEWRANLATERDDVVPLDPYVNFQTPIHFLCKKCNNVFYSTPMSVIHHMFCPHCEAVKQSKGEVLVRRVLTDLGIQFQEQKKFPGLKHRHSLKFDFYLPDFNVCIEYNGHQHYEAVDYFGGEEHLEVCQTRDAKKVEFCVNNDILLHYIPYTKKTYEDVYTDIVDWLAQYFIIPDSILRRETYAEKQ